MAIWQDGTSIKELGGMSFHSGAEEEPMRLATLVTATALGLGGFATAYIYHDKSGAPQRYGVVARAVGCAAELQINDEPQ